MKKENITMDEWSAIEEAESGIRDIITAFSNIDNERGQDTRLSVKKDVRNAVEILKKLEGIL